MKQYGLFIFLLLSFFCSNICSSEEVNNYFKEFIERYIPSCYYPDQIIKSLVRRIAYAAVEKPKLMEDFKNTVLNCSSRYTGQLLNSGFNIKLKDVLYTISIASPINGPKTVEDYAVFILESSLLTEEEYVQNMKKILDMFKKCKDIEKEMEILKI